MAIVVYTTGSPAVPAKAPLTPGTFYVIGLDGPPWGTVTFDCDGCPNCPQPLDFNADSPQTEFGPCPDCPVIVAHCQGHPEKVLR